MTWNWIEVLTLLFVFQAVALFTSTAILTRLAARAKLERDAWLHGFHHLTEKPDDVAGALDLVQSRLDEALPFVKAVKVLRKVRDGS